MSHSNVASIFLVVPPCVSLSLSIRSLLYLCLLLRHLRFGVDAIVFVSRLGSLHDVLLVA